ncbi:MULTISPECIES: hypothetical protein [unclassified Streptomyces]|uniref:hypothetical protein n=1 Tax=unclassified Streptomyces TaxID=2593676 RepID=UPI002256B0DB|nr:MULTISPECIES: hypothetical protein [unclassified Streptomyces]MCX4405944.1 hypothetical protein [Streptomyces sp. NBC_01764]MCX5189532.1 hypothetical protein [Streptomyces sp. NBC_00268]
MTDAQIPQDDGIQVEDVAAVRREGGGELRQLLRARTTIGKSRREPPAKPKLPPQPGHQPGAWPSGSSPPGPAPERSLPPEAWADAVRRYRVEQRGQLDQEDR